MIIGAGILGIPYVIMKTGFAIGIAHIIIIAALMIITTLYLGEIALRTKAKHHLTGYAAKYLGKKGKLAMFIAMSFGIYAALLAYLIGEGESLSHLIFGTPQYALLLGIAFWVFLSALSYYGLKALEEGEIIGVAIILALVISITVYAWNKIDLNNLAYVNYSNIFLPFGVILFAFLGFAAIPEVERILGKDRKLLKRTILLSNLLVLVVYTIFAAIVLGFKGSATPQIATLALGKPFILLGMITMFTSYLALSIALIDTIRFDFRKTKKKAWLYTIFIPLIIYVFLYLIKKTSFVKVLGVGGVISGGLTAILILLMVKSAKKKGDRKPEYSIPYSKILTYVLAAIFIIGAVLEIFYSII
jgi:amino acid permease